MERLNVLKPNVKKGTLANSRRERVEYLQVPCNLTQDILDVCKAVRYGGIKVVRRRNMITPIPCPHHYYE